MSCRVIVVIISILIFFFTNEQVVKPLYELSKEKLGKAFDMKRMGDMDKSDEYMSEAYQNRLLSKVFHVSAIAVILLSIKYALGL